MLVHKLIADGAVPTNLTLACSHDDDNYGDDIPDTKCITEYGHVIIDVDKGSFVRLDREQTIELAKFLLSCASVMPSA